MSWKCTLGLHRPSVVSIARKTGGLHALCEGCGVPLERTENARWRTMQPLVGQMESTGEAA
jgi:hypothetical protein